MPTPDIDANRDGTVTLAEFSVWLGSRYTQAFGALVVVGGILTRLGVLDAPPAPCPVVPEAAPVVAPAPVDPPAPARDTDTPEAPAPQG